MSLFTIFCRQVLGGRTWQLLLAALVLAVTAVTMLQFTSATLLTAVTQQAGQLLAGDVAITSTTPIDPMWVKRAVGLHQTSVIVFNSMAQTGDQFVLSSVKAISTGFPLRGALSIHYAQSSSDHPFPPSGVVWVEPRILDLLHTTVGGQLRIGDLQFTIGGVIDRDSNRELGMNGLSPEIIMNVSDVSQTHVIQPGSRIEYRLLLAGESTRVQQFVDMNRPLLTSKERMRTATQNNDRLTRPIHLLSQYAQLTGILVLVLCGMALMQASRRFADTLQESMALLRCLGASSRQLTRIYIAALLLLLFLGLIIGSVLGVWGAYELLSLLKNSLPSLDIRFAPSLFLRQPLLAGSMTAAIVLLGFTLPALMRLSRVSPLRMIRGDLPVILRPWRTGLMNVMYLLIIWVGITGIMVQQTSELRFSIVVVCGLTGLIALLFAIIWGVVGLLKRLSHRLAPYIRHPLQMAIQLTSLTLGLALISLVVMLRHDLIRHWQVDLPPNTPNQFVYGLPADQRTSFQEAITVQHWSMSPMYPIIRGRLLKVNGRELSTVERQRNRLDRELNLTMAAVLPEGNRLLAGQPLTKAGQISMEQGLAERLHLQLGDHLTFTLPEGQITAVVTNFRSVAWNSFQPNFFFILTPGTLDEHAGSYMASFYVPERAHAALAAIVQQFPEAMLLDMEMVLGEVRHLLDLLADALTLLVLMVGLAGLLVLISSLHVSLDERSREAALLRVLGATQSALRQRILMELGLQALICACIAIIFTEVVAAFVAHELGLSLHGHPLFWGVMVLGMVVLSILVGLAQLSGLWRMRPQMILRRLQQ